jgi:hypothetical protein
VTEPELRESWFNQEVKPSLPPPSSLVPPPPPPPRGPRLVLGAIAGGGAGVGGLAVAQILAGRLAASPMPVDVVARLGGGAWWAGYAIGALAGAPIGALLAVAIMHGTRFITRAIFASGFSAAIWFCVHIFMIARHAAAPPLVPMLAGAGVYGTVLAFLPRAKN